MKLSRKLQLLEAPIQDSIRSMHQARLGYLPNKIDCHFLKSLCLIVSVERLRSPTEQFLLEQNRPQLAQEIGRAINEILRTEIVKLLENNFQLTVVECSFLTPNLIESFSLWISVETDKLKSASQSASQSQRAQQNQSNGDSAAVATSE